MDAQNIIHDVPYPLEVVLLMAGKRNQLWGISEVEELQKTPLLKSSLRLVLARGEMEEIDKTTE